MYISDIDIANIILYYSDIVGGTMSFSQIRWLDVNGNLQQGQKLVEVQHGNNATDKTTESSSERNYANRLRTALSVKGLGYGVATWQSADLAQGHFVIGTNTYYLEVKNIGRHNLTYTVLDGDKVIAKGAFLDD